MIADDEEDYTIVQRFLPELQPVCSGYPLFAVLHESTQPQPSVDRCDEL